MVTLEEWKNYKSKIKKNRKYCLLHGKKALVKKLYFEVKNQKLNLDDVKLFTEKLQKIKLSKNKKFIICADKNSVRTYVKDKIGGKYLVKQYFCKNRITKKDLEKLPSAFVLKTTSGSSTNVIVRDKRKEDLDKICTMMNYYKKIKYGYLWGEFYYNKIKNKIIAEELLSDESIDDYKIHCFRNNGKLVQIIEVIYETNTSRMKNMYDSNWKKLDYYFSLKSDGRNVEKPKQLKKLLELANKLSEEFNYVRVDFYIIKNKIYFGELTFVPTAGYGDFNPNNYNSIWGNYIGEDIK